MTEAELRAHLREHFQQTGATAEPDAASVTFVGLQPITVLRFGPDRGGVTHHVSVGGSRRLEHAEEDGTPTEVVVSLRAPSLGSGLARSVAVLAAAPVVEGLVPTVDALIDLGQPLWQGASFTAVLLGNSEIAPTADVQFLQAIPITPNEAAWVRLKGADAMRQAWAQDGVEVLDIERRAARPR